MAYHEVAVDFVILFSTSNNCVLSLITSFPPEFGCSTDKSLDGSPWGGKGFLHLLIIFKQFFLLLFLLLIISFPPEIGCRTD